MPPRSPAADVLIPFMLPWQAAFLFFGAVARGLSRLGFSFTPSAGKRGFAPDRLGFQEKSGVQKISVKMLIFIDELQKLEEIQERGFGRGENIA